MSLRMTENERKTPELVLSIKRNLSLARLILPRLSLQPNRKYSLSLLLDDSGLPGSDWIRVVQQTLRTGALNRHDPINIRADQIKSTSARRLFKNPVNSDSILIEVTPLASHVDASTRVDTFVERHVPRISGISNMTGYEVIEEPGSCELRPFKCVQYTWGVQGRMRTNRSVAGAFQNIFVYANYTSYENPMAWQSILDLASLQCEKIRTVTGNSPA
jgi:hypothetical protein